jgi:hypothetical protein
MEKQCLLHEETASLMLIFLALVLLGAFYGILLRFAFHSITFPPIPHLNHPHPFYHHIPMPQHANFCSSANHSSVSFEVDEQKTASAAFHFLWLFPTLCIAFYLSLACQYFAHQLWCMSQL